VISKHILKKLLYCIILSVNLLSAYAEENELKYILSLDTGFTMTALRNYGFGLGINYEHKLTDFLSIKPGLGSI
jgi:hypothetical protein